MNPAPGMAATWPLARSIIFPVTCGYIFYSNCQTISGTCGLPASQEHRDESRRGGGAGAQCCVSGRPQGTSCGQLL